MKSSLAGWLADNRETLLPRWAALLELAPQTRNGNGHAVEAPTPAVSAAESVAHPDERRVLLQLTPSGRRLKARAVAVPQAIACATACDLSEVSALAAQLRQLRDRLIESSSRAA